MVTKWKYNKGIEKLWQVRKKLLLTIIPLVVLVTIIKEGQQDMQDVLEVMRQIVLGMEESADIIAESSNILVENMIFFKI